MSPSFNPGQPAQTGQVPQNSSVAPPLVVPSVPTIATAGNAAEEEKVSPFAFKNRSKSKFGVYFQSAIFVLFGGCLFYAIGLFAYQGYLKAQVASKVETLNQKQSSFPKLMLPEMQKLSDRLTAVNQAFKEHSSVRTALLILEDGIEHPVTYTKFDLTYNEAKKSYVLGLSATAPDYVSIIQQQDTLRSKVYSKFFTPVSLSNIILNEKGTVTFKIATTIALQGLVPEDMVIHPSSQDQASSTMSTVESASSTAILNSVTPQ